MTNAYTYSLSSAAAGYRQYLVSDDEFGLEISVRSLFWAVFSYPERGKWVDSSAYELIA